MLSVDTFFLNRSSGEVFCRNAASLFEIYFFLCSVAHEGKVVVAGFASKQIPQVETSSLMPRAFSLVGVSLSNYRQSDPEVYRYAVFFYHY